ncbi:MAG: acyltransferase [Pseudoalteromonas sp.]|nr:acyltransferase [Pseudoalteromonas sp.]
MKKIRRFVLMKMLIPLLRFIGGVMYDKKYLTGRYFDESLMGWRWVWRGFWTQKFMGINKHVPWPCSQAIAIDDPSGVIFDPNDMQNFLHTGCYFSNVGGGKIYLGSGTVIAPNVGIVTTNHSFEDPSIFLPPQDVHVGEKCWLALNCVLLPGVVLGPHTVVAAGAVVNKSYPEGNVVLAGVPAKVIRRLETNESAQQVKAQMSKAQ